MNKMDISKKPKRELSKKQKQYTEKKTEDPLGKLIHRLTHSGNKSLDSETTTEVVNICKGSERDAATALDLTMEQLEQRHAEIRLSAFQLIDELFRRVAGTRPGVVKRLERVLDLTTSTKVALKPACAARDLRTFALLTLREWSTLFGKQHFRLVVAYEYMRDVEKVDFESLAREREGVEVEQRPNRSEDRPPRADPVTALRVKRVMKEIEDKEEDIRTSAVSLTNCINLLLPHPEDFFIVSDDEGNEPSTSARSREIKPAGYQDIFERSEDAEADRSDSEESVGDTGLREVGMASTKHSIQLEFTPSSEALIEETVDNAAIIENARECARLISNKYLPTVKAWLEVLSKSPEHKEKCKQLNELKGELEDLQFKFGRLKFSSADDSSSDSDLEEVLEKVDTKGESKNVESKEWSIVSGEKASRHPTDTPRVKAEQSRPSTSDSSDRKQRLLAVAPKRPFDVDLYHWEDEKLTAPTLIPSSMEGHRFWASEDGVASELPAPGGAASLRTRVIEYSGKFAPVTRSCRARLPSGKLCPRRDRLKCPFHGEIVPRDETGRCTSAEDAERLQAIEEKRQQERPDWQDPRLLADIKKATGIDLKMPEKGKRRKRKADQPGLTNLKAEENTIVKRLEKKIFNKSAMKRVASALDRADQRKFKDKFGDQFNYFYS